MQTAAATAKKKQGFFIEVGCPGCGGALELKDDFFVLGCNHCGSVLRITMPAVPPAYVVRSGIDHRELRFRIDRHLKENGLPLTSSQLHVKRIYYPYWKIDAVVLKVRNRIESREITGEDGESQGETIDTRKTDISLSPYTMTLAAGDEVDGVPAMLGLRSQYLKLLPYSVDNVQDDFHAMPVIRPWETAFESASSSARGTSMIELAAFGRNTTELFMPRASIVYMPILLTETYGPGGVTRYVVDGVTGRVLNHEQRQEREVERLEQGQQIEFGKLGVDFHRCGNCGVDLPPVQSYIYVCSNCFHVTYLEHHEQVTREILVADDPGAANDGLYPFWAMSLDGEDQAAVKRLFGGIYDSDVLVVPAFRMSNFESVYRLTRRMSSAWPKLSLAEMSGFDRRAVAATLGPTEAQVLAGVVVARERAARRNQYDGGAEPVRPRRISLMYLPFHPQSYFMVDSVLQTVTFEKNQIPQ
jgi:hypothetical protein